MSDHLDENASNHVKKKSTEPDKNIAPNVRSYPNVNDLLDKFAQQFQQLMSEYKANKVCTFSSDKKTRNNIFFELIVLAFSCFFYDE